MKNAKLAIVGLTMAMLSSINFQLSTALAQGSLAPPGAPAPTMKSLDQIEARTPISSAPFNITQPGSYYLTTNLTVNFGNAINIMTNDVTLDLNGFGIISTENPASAGVAVELSSGLRNIAIANGFIQSGVTNNGSGVYGGSGFGFAVAYLSSPPVNVRVSGISVSGCLYDGIYLNTGDSTAVESCTVRTAGSHGILASTVKNSTAMGCGSDAIVGDEVSDSEGQSTGVGDGLYAYHTALNCSGQSSSGDGLGAGNSAENCYGHSGGNGDGIRADSTAQNCHGESSGSGDGVYAVTALNCLGKNNGSGDGLKALSAQNCWGYSSSGIGLQTYDIAIGCYGQSSTGTGLVTYIANSCFSTTGDSGITYKYNMP
jgi:hypothetical protein